jgi:hypothetical protein
VDNNYVCNSIFQNTAIVRSGKDSKLLDVNFFGKQFYAKNKLGIRSLTYGECFVNGKFKSIKAFTESTGLCFPPAVWMNLQAAIIFAKKTL